MNKNQFANIRVILICREESALAELESLLGEIGSAVVAAKFTNTLEALQVVQHSIDVAAADLIILDMMTPGIDGISAAKRFKKIRENIEIAFITNSPNYAMEAFKVHALDYLMRPVSKERLQRTLDRLQILR